MITTTLQCKIINGQTHVLVPLSTLLSLLGADASVKQLALPFAKTRLGGGAPANSAVIIPPMSEEQAMDNALEDFRQHGVPEVEHWRGGFRVE